MDNETSSTAPLSSLNQMRELRQLKPVQIPLPTLVGNLNPNLTPPTRRPIEQSLTPPTTLPAPPESTTSTTGQTSVDTPPAPQASDWGTGTYTVEAHIGDAETRHSVELVERHKVTGDDCETVMKLWCEAEGVEPQNVRLERWDGVYSVHWDVYVGKGSADPFTWTWSDRWKHWRDRFTRMTGRPVAAITGVDGRGNRVPVYVGRGTIKGCVCYLGGPYPTICPIHCEGA